MDQVRAYICYTKAYEVKDSFENMAKLVAENDEARIYINYDKEIAVRHKSIRDPDRRATTHLHLIRAKQYNTIRGNISGIGENPTMVHI